MALAKLLLAEAAKEEKDEWADGGYWSARGTKGEGKGKKGGKGKGKEANPNTFINEDGTPHEVDLQHKHGRLALKAHRWGLRVAEHVAGGFKTETVAQQQVEGL